MVGAEAGAPHKPLRGEGHPPAIQFTHAQRDLYEVPVGEKETGAETASGAPCVPTASTQPPGQTPPCRHPSLHVVPLYSASRLAGEDPSKQQHCLSRGRFSEWKRSLRYPLLFLGRLNETWM